MAIATSSGLYMAAWGHAADRRFARVFRQAWRKVPLSARRVTVRHWRRYRDAYAAAAALIDVPLVEVLDYKSNFHRGRSKDAVGQCDHMGTVLAFWAPWVDRLPDEHLETLIAHELAHVYLIATRPGHMQQRYSRAESEVYAVLSEWGFDEDSYWQWVEDKLADLQRSRRARRA